MANDSSVSDGTETLKTEILNMLTVPTGTVNIFRVNSIDAPSARKEIVDRFEKANARLVAICREPADHPLGRDSELEGKISKTAYEVTRYFSGLAGSGPLTGKPAKSFAATRDKALANLVKLEALANEAEKKFADALETVNNEIEALKTTKQEKIDEIGQELERKKLERGALRVTSFADRQDAVTSSTRAFYQGKVNELKPLKKPTTDQQRQLRIAEANLLKVNTHEQLGREVDTAKLKKETLEEELKNELETKSNELEGLKRTQMIDWSNPADIVYGTKIDSTQLNAKLTAGDGILEYSGPNGEYVLDRVLDAGDGLTLRVTAKGTDKYKKSAPKEVTINIKLADLVIVWNDPAEITYGTQLSATQLNATVTTTPSMPDSYAGLIKKLKYFVGATEIAAGSALDAGDHTLTAKMTGENKNFKPATDKTVPLKVKPAEQVIAWTNPTPLEITYGTGLSTGQLNATVTTNPPLPGMYGTLTGALKYFDATGEVKKGSVLAAGEHTLTVKTSANPNFTAAADKTATFDVKKAEREIGSSALKPIECVVTAQDMNQIKAKVKFTKGAGELEYSVGTVKLAVGATLKVGDGQTLKAVATPSTNYKETLDEEVEVDVIKENPVITWKEPKPLVAPATLQNAQLNAVLVKGDKPLVYSPKENDPVSVGTVFLSVTHAESVKFERGTKTVRLMVYANQATGKGFEDMRNGSAWDTTTLTPNEVVLLNNWNTDKNEVKAKTQELMSNIKELSGPDLKNFMNSLVPDTANRVDETVTNPLKPYPNLLWALPDGMQVRYKPNGDAFNSNPMFCIEARTSAGCTQNSSQVAFKVTMDGVAASKGPSQNKPPSSSAYSTASYNSGTCNATHLECAPKVDQHIEWHIPDDLKYGAKVSEDWAKVPREGGAKTFTPAKDALLPVGDGQNLSVTASGTDKYKPTTVNTTIDVKPAKQVITWENPEEITYGTELSATQLNAAVATDPADAAGIVAGTLDTLRLALQYTNEKGEKLDGLVLDVGEGQKLKVAAPATTHFEASSKEVTIKVKPAEQVIAWGNPTPKEITVGTELSAGQLNATVTTNPPLPGRYDGLTKALKYFDAEGKEVKIGTVLAVGEHTLRVKTADNKNFIAATDQTATFTVKQQD